MIMTMMTMMLGSLLRFDEGGVKGSDWSQEEVNGGRSQEVIKGLALNDQA